jgi:hypothetical protein
MVHHPSLPALDFPARSFLHYRTNPYTTDGLYAVSAQTPAPEAVDLRQSCWIR